MSEKKTNTILPGNRVKAQFYSTFGKGRFTGTIESVEPDGYMVRPDEQYSNLKTMRIFFEDIEVLEEVIMSEKYCECIQCASIHVRGGNERNGETDRITELEAENERYKRMEKSLHKAYFGLGSFVIEGEGEWIAKNAFTSLDEAPRFGSFLEACEVLIGEKE